MGVRRYHGQLYEDDSVMAAETKVTIKGGEAIQRALLGPELLQRPVRKALWASTGEVELQAKLLAPSDRGRLRNTIRSRVLGIGLKLLGRVRVGAKYAPYVEFGTRPHWPPRFTNGWPTLQPWAKRHGFPSGVRGSDIVRAIIARKGTRAQPFMEPALQQSEGKIKLFLAKAAREIERWWEFI